MVLQVTSLGGLQRVGTNVAGAMEVRPYFPDDQTEQERREAVAALRSDGMYVPGLLTQDGNGTAVIVRLVGDTKADMKRAGVEAAMRATAERLPNGHLLPERRLAGPSCGHGSNVRCSRTLRYCCKDRA